MIEKKRAKPKRKPRAKPKGRPRIKIDKIELEKLAALHCTQAEAAGFFGCSPATMERRLMLAEYRDIWEMGLQRGKVSLRRSQFRLAERNATMAIFLGKQYLGQRDEQRHEHIGEGGGPIPFTIDLTGATSGGKKTDSDEGGDND
jgi:hypothetical protein